LKPEINYELDYSWISGNLPASIPDEIRNAEALNIDIPMTYQTRRYGPPLLFEANLNPFHLASQTAQCNRINIGDAHFHTYQGLMTPPDHYRNTPKSSYLLWDAPEALSVPEIPVVDEILAMYNVITQTVPSTCCARRRLHVSWDGGVEWRCVESHVCKETKEYQPFVYDEIGFPAGMCVDVRFNPLFGTNLGDMNLFETCCPLYRAKFGQVVDYYFPTQKISMSRQPFHSRYLRMEDVVDINSGELKALKESLHGTAFDGSAGQQAIEDVTKKEKIPTYHNPLIPPGLHSYQLSPYDLLADPWDPPNLNEISEIHSLGDLIDAREELLDLRESLRGLANFSRGKNNRGFIRFLQEKKIEEDVLQHHYAPHVYPENDGEVGQPFYATDFVMDPTEGIVDGQTVTQKWGAELAYWLIHSAAHDDSARMYQSEEDWDTNEEHPEMPWLDHPERCARNNTFTSRTPEYLLLGICPEADASNGTEENPYCKSPWSKPPLPYDTYGAPDFHSMQCFPDVGEVRFNATTRKSNTDYLMQTLAKGYKQFHKRFPHGNKTISLDLNKDRFHIFPSKKFNDINYLDIRDLGAIWRGSAFFNEVFPEELNGRLNADIKHSDMNLGIFSEIPGIEDLLEPILGGRCEKLSDFKNRGRDSWRNWEYQSVNSTGVDTVGSHGETTLEVFTLFSGCYGWPGKTDWDIDMAGLFSIDSIIRILPSEFGPFGGLRVR
ncbi:MAG: hypothetical protein KDD55_04915, partial [Bdellovibrionales bacterium]|nr:hypothetical protein [Bdellovibrionales bacterium]